MNTRKQPKAPAFALPEPQGHTVRVARICTEIVSAMALFHPDSFEGNTINMERWAFEIEHHATIYARALLAETNGEATPETIKAEENSHRWLEQAFAYLFEPHALRVELEDIRSEHVTITLYRTIEEHTKQDGYRISAFFGDEQTDTRADITNDDRCKRAGRALQHYTTGVSDDEQAQVTDLLTDLRHFCDWLGLDFGKALYASELAHDAEAHECECPECARSFGPHYTGPCEH